MNTENIAKEFEAIVEKDIGRSVRTVSPIRTVSADIEALKAKLDTIAKGINLLKEQL